MQVRTLVFRTVEDPGVAARPEVEPFASATLGTGSVWTLRAYFAD